MKIFELLMLSKSEYCLRNFSSKLMGTHELGVSVWLKYLCTVMSHTLRFVLLLENSSVHLMLQSLGSDVLEPVSGSLNRAQSAHALNSTKDLAKEDGLKRVSSEPLLSGQGKGALLKRKLSFSEQDTVVCEDGKNKHKKQGGKQSFTVKFRVYLPCAFV